MEMDSFIIDGLKEFLKRHKTEITINDTNKKIFFKLIKSRNIINKIQNNKRIKRFIQTTIFNTKNKNYNCKKITYLEKNKYIFILISLIISLIIYSQNNILEKNLTTTSEILNYIYLFVLKLFKSKLVSFDYINLFFHLFFELIEKNVIDFNQKIEKILYILLVYKKFLKNLGEIYYDNQDNQIKKAINKSMYEILRKIFVMNNNNNIAFIKCCNFFSEKTNILEILKIAYNYYDNNIISDDNKRMIKSNLIKNFTYNFKKKQFDYLYFILKKFLRNFNNKNSSKRTYDNNISLISGINEFILDIYKSETDKILKNEYYFDKYFIFDINEKNSGIKAGPIQFDKSHSNGITIIFSFYAMKVSYDYNKPQVLLSFINEQAFNCLFKIELMGNKMNLVKCHKHEEKKTVLMENIVYYRHTVCILYYDFKLKFVHFYSNKAINAQKVNLDINYKTNIYVEIGYRKNLDDVTIDKFNGIIGPVLIFNSKIEEKKKKEIFQQKILSDLKGKYYLIGDVMNLPNKSNQNNYIFFNQIYYDNLDKNIIECANNVKNELGRLLLYLNPDNILNTIGYEKKIKFRDYLKYYNFDNKEVNVNYYINTDNSIGIFTQKENNIIYSILENNGYNIILLNIEYIYNYLLIINSNDYNKINFTTM